MHNNKKNHATTKKITSNKPSTAKLPTWNIESLERLRCPANHRSDQVVRLRRCARRSERVETLAQFDRLLAARRDAVQLAERKRARSNCWRAKKANEPVDVVRCRLGQRANATRLEHGDFARVERQRHNAIVASRCVDADYDVWRHSVQHLTPSLIAVIARNKIQVWFLVAFVPVIVDLTKSIKTKQKIQSFQ